MPFLPQLAVVFVGILGGGHGKVDQQVTKVVRELKVAPIKVPADKLKAIAHHAAGFREVVRALHADGVVVRNVQVREPELEEVFVELAK